MSISKIMETLNEERYSSDSVIKTDAKNISKMFGLDYNLATNKGDLHVNNLDRDKQEIVFDKPEKIFDLSRLPFEISKIYFECFIPFHSYSLNCEDKSGKHYGVARSNIDSKDKVLRYYDELIEHINKVLGKESGSRSNERKGKTSNRANGKIKDLENIKSQILSSGKFTSKDISVEDDGSYIVVTLNLDPDIYYDMVKTPKKKRFAELSDDEGYEASELLGLDPDQAGDGIPQWYIDVSDLYDEDDEDSIEKIHNYLRADSLYKKSDLELYD